MAGDNVLSLAPLSVCLSVGEWNETASREREMTRLLAGAAARVPQSLLKPREDGVSVGFLEQGASL